MGCSWEHPCHALAEQLSALIWSSRGFSAFLTHEVQLRAPKDPNKVQTAMGVLGIRENLVAAIFILFICVSLLWSSKLANNFKKCSRLE